jgi:hypothetical protein
MSAPCFSQFVPEKTIRIDGNTKPLGRLRWASCVRYFLNDCIGFGRQLICKVDEVFRPERQDDGGFFVPQFDSDKLFAPVVHDGADYYVAVGRYLDPVHGTVVATFVRPATPSDIASFCTREAQDHVG